MKRTLFCLFSFGLLIAGGSDSDSSQKQDILRKRTHHKQKKKDHPQVSLESDPTILTSILSLGYWVQTSLCGASIPNQEKGE